MKMLREHRQLFCLFSPLRNPTKDVTKVWRGVWEEFSCKSRAKFEVIPSVDPQVMRHSVLFWRIFLLKQGFPDVPVCFCSSTVFAQKQKGKEWETTAPSLCPHFPLWSVLISFTVSVIRVRVFYEQRNNLSYGSNSCWWIAQQWPVLKEQRQEGERERKCCYFFFSIQAVIGSLLLLLLPPLLLPLLHLALLPVHCGIEISQRWESNSICWADTHTHTHTRSETLEAVHPGTGLSKQAHSK